VWAIKYFKECILLCYISVLLTTAELSKSYKPFKSHLCVCLLTRMSEIVTTGTRDCSLVCRDILATMAHAEVVTGVSKRPSQLRYGLLFSFHVIMQACCVCAPVGAASKCCDMKMLAFQVLICTCDHVNFDLLLPLVAF